MLLLVYMDMYCIQLSMSNALAHNVYLREIFISIQDSDKEGVSLHNGVWAPLFLMGAGTCM